MMAALGGGLGTLGSLALLNSNFFNLGFWLVDLLLLLAIGGVVVVLATDDRDPSTVLAWMFVVLLFPVLGLIAYFFIGRNYRRDSKKRRAILAHMEQLRAHSVEPTEEANAAFTAAAVAATTGTAAHRVQSTARREDGSAMLPSDTVDIYTAGSQKFPALLAEMATAEKYIHLMYLIWEQDELTAKVTEILLERMKAGVEVHILYDWLSCISYKKDELKKLAAAGATVVPCYKRLPQFNYRNHMKMVIIDGKSVYSGGMNMGQEYIDGGPRFAVWRDTSFRLSGPAVIPYLYLYGATWILNGRHEDLISDYLPPVQTRAPGEGIPVQVLHSSVGTTFKAIRDVFITALLGARERIWIQSPYFVPDEPLITAMCAAAASGIDVRFMMTGKPDKKIPYYAAHAYYPLLLRSGVKVYLYKAGFLHAKTVTVDEEFSIMGTCNWDIRSIILHDEVVSIFYDHEVARTYASQYEKDIADCTEVTWQYLDGFTGGQKFRNSIYRLFSRLL
jgi:cardiolipin synthase A/B